MKKKLLIPIFLAAMALPLGLSNKATGLSAEFIGETNDRTTYLKEKGIPTNSQLADEGFVLLKNDGSLPLEEGAKVSIVGKASTNLARGGGGSGSGSVANSVKNLFPSDQQNLDLVVSLKAAGFDVNATATSFYQSASGGRTNGNDGWKGNSEVTIGETPIASVTGNANLMASLDEYNDAILQVITREGSEGCDVKTCNAHDSQKTNSSNKVISEKHALELSDNEQALFDELHNHTDHIIIVINSSNIFECDQFEKDDQVSGVLWIGNPGDVGPLAVGRILSGEVNPSGHTVDTWTRDFTKDPSFQNFSDNAQTNKMQIGNDMYYVPQDTMFNADGTPTFSFGTDKNYKDHNSPRWDNARGGEEGKVVSGGINGVKPSAYVSYEEGIYVDYRYYETRYDDMLAIDGKNDADEWYEGEEGVVYPFGYGLSYTTFDQEIVSSNVSGKTLKSGNAKIDVTVKVTNTGDVAGKEVVQLYWQAPYYDGEIEKASKVLCAFDKTQLLEPGEEEELTLSLNTQDFANYDFSDANNNDFKGYELDGGDYRIILGKNAHEEIDAVEFKVAEDGIQYETDRFTGNEVKNRFTDRGFYNSLPGEDDIEFTQFSREDMVDTFPTHPTIDSRTLGEDSRFEEYFTHEFTIAEVDIEQNFENVPEAVYKTKEDIEALGWEQGNGSTAVKFTDLLNTAIDDPRWDDFMNQLTWAEMIEYVYGPGKHNVDISRLNKPNTSDSDGPQRFKSGDTIFWVSSPIIAATFNVDLAKAQGDCIGIEAHLAGSTVGWAGPAVNTHRSPFGGRNFEYYSADPFLMGRIAGRVVAGATDRGMYCFFKHFVVNDQEKNRESTATFLTEQALREIYLKPFQMAIQEGKSIGLMSSYNRLGLMETAASYPLLTEVLREEWGFKGSIISDMTHSGNSSVNFKCYENINNRVLAGCDQQLDNGGGFKGDMNCTWDSTKGCPVFKTDPNSSETYESYTYWYAVRTCAQRVIWMCARSAVNSRTFVQNEEEIVASNLDRGVYYGEVGQDVEINISLPQYLQEGEEFEEGVNVVSSEVSIDEFTPLPDGLRFDGEKISGSTSEPYNGFTHVLVTVELDDNTTEKYGISFELRIYATGNNGEFEEEPEPTPVDPTPTPTPVDPTPAPADDTPSSSEQAPAKKKGCGGELEISLISIAVLGTIALGALLIERKRRVAK